MSMLAERKRKTKWIINPTKKPLWTTDSNGIKFGKGLMEKMGWSAGKGLGANEQGIQEPLKVSYKNDTKGMGFKGNDDDWIEHQDGFNCFLNQLRNCDESFVVKLSDAEKNEVKSLEEKSKWSKARVHYQKFTRGKDLSKYSENDLACILGTNKTKNEKSKVEEVIQSDSKINNNMETHFGVTTINSGSIQDYFKKKWIVHKKTKGEEGNEGVETAQNENSYFSTPEDDNFVVKDEKKSKKKKLKLNSEECVETTITPQSDDLEKLKKEKKKKKREREIVSEEETENKRKKNDFDLVNGFSGDVAVDLKNKEKKVKVENNDDGELEKFITKEENIFEIVNIKEEKELKDQKKKKKKKDKEELKNKDPYCIENGVGSEEKHEVFEAEIMLEKKKKSKKEKHLENDVEGKVSCDISDSTNQCNAEVTESCLVVKKKKKKKDKKKESAEKEEVENCCSKNSNVNVENIKEANETEISSELVSKQKKKKDKKEKIESVASLEEENKSTSIVEVITEVESIRKKKKKKDKSERSDINENKSTNEIESLPEVELSRKKNKKEHTKESEEVENFRNSESDVNENSLEEKKNLKKRQIISENEPVKKKMKKSKKDKSLQIEEIELTENNSETTGILKINEETVEIPNQREFSPKVESVKKKKHKKEKLIEKEETDFVDNNTIKITNTSELTADKKKKKKKKDKMKETSSDYIETENSESCLKENNCENDEANTQKEKKVEKQEKNSFVENSCEARKSDEDKTEKKIEKTDIVNDKQLDFSTNNRCNYDYNSCGTNFPLTGLGYSNNNYNSQFFNNGFLHHQNNISNLFNFLYSYNYFNNVLNTGNFEVNNGNQFQSHKTEILNDKKADKFYPGQDQREKILRLIHLTDFGEFKGSNLEKLMGYGFRKHKIHNKPV